MSLRLDDPINGHRAVCAERGRSVNHATGIPMEDSGRDVNSAAGPTIRPAKYLTVSQRDALPTQGNLACCCIGVGAARRGDELTVS